MLKALVSPRNIELSQGGRVYPGYGGNADFTLSNTTTRLAASAGGILSSITAFPSLDAMRQALPMVQAILLMALIICLPLVIIFSAYDLQTIVTITFVQFAMTFATFWWELARWLDAWLMRTLYSSDSHSHLNFAGVQNTTDDIILPFIIGAMFILLPAFWIGALSWAGIKAGHAVQSFAQQGSNDARNAGGSAANFVVNKGIGKMMGK